MANGIKTHPDQTLDDDELYAIGYGVMGSIGWHLHTDNPGLNEHDWRRVYDVADSCDSCGTYVDPCEMTEGLCDNCWCEQEENDDEE